MSILSRLLGSRRQEPLSLHTMVSNELRLLVSHLVADSEFPLKNRIREAVNADTMQWFRIRPRGYGESGSHFGVLEVTGHPRSVQLWPYWMKLVPSDDLAGLAGSVREMCADRAPEGGHEMHDENRRRAVCEFTGQLITRLTEMETDSRQSGGV